MIAAQIWSKSIERRSMSVDSARLYGGTVAMKIASEKAAAGKFRDLQRLSIYRVPIIHGMRLIVKGTKTISPVRKYQANLIIRRKNTN